MGVSHQEGAGNQHSVFMLMIGESCGVLEGSAMVKIKHRSSVDVTYLFFCYSRVSDESVDSQLRQDNYECGGDTDNKGSVTAGIRCDR